LFYFN